MFQIFVASLAIVIAVGLIMALMVWKKIISYRVFLPTGIIVISASIILTVIRVYALFFSIQILLLGLIYLIIGLVKVQWNWIRVIMLVIGVLVSQMAVVGTVMWAMTQQYALMALSVAFIFVGIALSIGAIVWPAKRGRRKIT